MTPQIYLISNPTKPTHRRLSFKNDMTTFERGLGWVVQQIPSTWVELTKGQIDDATAHSDNHDFAWEIEAICKRNNGFLRTTQGSEK